MKFSIGEEVIFKDEQWFIKNLEKISSSGFRHGHTIFFIEEDVFNKKFIVINTRYCNFCLTDEVKIKKNK